MFTIRQNTSHLHHVLVLTNMIVLMVACVGCEKAQISSYFVPKENLAVSRPDGLDEWKVPEGWMGCLSAGPVVATFRVYDSPSQGNETNKSLGGAAIITVATFDGSMGELSPNIARWAGQLGIKPPDENEAKKVVSPIEVDGFSGRRVKLKNPADAQALVVDWVEAQGNAWFFKVIGNAEVVEKTILALDGFTRSIRFAKSKFIGTWQGRPAEGPQMTWTFKADGTGTINVGGVPLKMTWQKSMGDKLKYTMEVFGEKQSQTVSYVHEGDALTINDPRIGVLVLNRSEGEPGASKYPIYLMHEWDTEEQMVTFGKDGVLTITPKNGKLIEGTWEGKTGTVKLTYPDSKSGENRTFEYAASVLQVTSEENGKEEQMEVLTLVDSSGKKTEYTRTVLPGEKAAKVFANPLPGLTSWEIPFGWQQGQPRPFVMGSFLIPGEQANVELTISKARGELNAHLMRWAGIMQMDLPGDPIKEWVTDMEVDGKSAHLVHMHNPDTATRMRLLMVSGNKGEESWFFKLKGHDAVTALKTEEFSTFIKSIRFTEDGKEN